MSPAPNESLPGVPSNIQQRQLSRENTGAADTTPPEERRASNIRDYHRSQIAEAQKVIAFHQEIVDEQNAILGEVEEEGRDADSPIPNDTDIAERYLNAFDSLYTVEELQDELRERDLPTSGNKRELIERLVNSSNDDDDDESTDDDSNNE